MRPFALLLLAACNETPIRDLAELATAVPNPPNLRTPTQHDVISQVEVPQVDILFVVDSSGSMAEEQQKLADNFDVFIDYLVDANLDYHIGVTTTDTERGAGGRLEAAGGQRWVDADTSDPVGVFGAMARVGTNGSADERGLRATQLALTDPNLSNHNAGFYREDAALHVIVISDEDDQSLDRPSLAEFTSWMNSLKSDPEQVTFSGIIGPRGGCATAVDGAIYRAAIHRIGGIEASICTHDWSSVLDELGLQAAGLRREYFLSEVPVPGTVAVTVDQGGFTYVGEDVSYPECPVETCFSFAYDEVRNAVVLDGFVPDALAVVRLTYELLSGQEVTEVEP